MTGNIFPCRPHIVNTALELSFIVYYMGWSSALPTIVPFICNGKHRLITRAIAIGIDVVEVRKIKALLDLLDLFPAVTVLGKKSPCDPAVFFFKLCCDQIDMLSLAPIFEP
jgi:hypothetical protein